MHGIYWPDDRVWKYPYVFVIECVCIHISGTGKIFRGKRDIFLILQISNDFRNEHFRIIICSEIPYFRLSGLMHTTGELNRSMRAVYI
jgi:hypothetical protein